jgi:hypothetical protein
MATAEQYASARELLLKSTLVPFPLEKFVLTDSETKLSDEFERLVQALEYNLVEAIGLASLPFTVGSEIANRELFQRLHIAARIRAKPAFGEGEDFAYNIAAFDAALEAFKRTISTHERPEKDGEYDYLFSVISATNGLLSSSDFLEKSQTLLRQATVLCWNALEVFVRDILELLMNEDIELALRFIDDQDAHSKFDLKKISLASLKNFDFNLSKKLGTYILDGRDLSDISSVRVSLSALFAGRRNLQEAIKSRDLYLLCKKRHLFVHRRGIVDNKFMAESNCVEKVGDRLSVLPGVVEKEVNMVWNIGREILESIKAHMKQRQA